MKVVVYQKYSVVNEVGTVMVGMVIDGKVDNGVNEGSVIDGWDDPEKQSLHVRSQNDLA